MELRRRSSGSSSPKKIDPQPPGTRRSSRQASLSGIQVNYTPTGSSLSRPNSGHGSPTKQSLISPRGPTSPYDERASKRRRVSITGRAASDHESRSTRTASVDSKRSGRSAKQAGPDPDDSPTARRRSKRLSNSTMDEIIVNVNGHVQDDLPLVSSPSQGSRSEGEKIVRAVTASRPRTRKSSVSNQLVPGLGITNASGPDLDKQGEANDSEAVDSETVAVEEIAVYPTQHDQDLTLDPAVGTNGTTVHSTLDNSASVAVDPHAQRSSDVTVAGKSVNMRSTQESENTAETQASEKDGSSHDHNDSNHPLPSDATADPRDPTDSAQNADRESDVPATEDNSQEDIENDADNRSTVESILDVEDKDDDLRMPASQVSIVNSPLAPIFEEDADGADDDDADIDDEDEEPKLKSPGSQAATQSKDVKPGRPPKKLPGRRRAPHTNPVVEAALRRQLHLKVGYRAVAKQLKPLLVELGKRNLRDLRTNPMAHLTPHENVTVTSELQSRLDRRMKLVQEEHRLKREKIRDTYETGIDIRKMRYRAQVRNIQAEFISILKHDFLMAVRSLDAAEDEDASEDEEYDVVPSLFGVNVHGRRTHVLPEKYDSRSRRILETDRLFSELQDRETHVGSEELSQAFSADVTASARPFTMFDDTFRKAAEHDRQLNALIDVLKRTSQTELTAQKQVAKQPKMEILPNQQATSLQLLASATVNEPIKPRPQIKDARSSISMLMNDPVEQDFKTRPSKVPGPMSPIRHSVSQEPPDLDRSQDTMLASSRAGQSTMAPVQQYSSEAKHFEAQRARTTRPWELQDREPPMPTDMRESSSSAHGLGPLKRTLTAPSASEPVDSSHSLSNEKISLAPAHDRNRGLQDGNDRATLDGNRSRHQSISDNMNESSKQSPSFATNPATPAFGSHGREKSYDPVRRSTVGPPAGPYPTFSPQQPVPTSYWQLPSLTDPIPTRSPHLSMSSPLDRHGGPPGELPGPGTYRPRLSSTASTFTMPPSHYPPGQGMPIPSTLPPSAPPGYPAYNGPVLSGPSQPPPSVLQAGQYGVSTMFGRSSNAIPSGPPGFPTASRDSGLPTTNVGQARPAYPFLVGGRGILAPEQDTTVPNGVNKRGIPDPTPEATRPDHRAYGYPGRPQKPS